MKFLDYLLQFIKWVLCMATVLTLSCLALFFITIWWRTDVISAIELFKSLFGW